VKKVCFVNTTGFWGGGEKLHLEYALKFREKGLHVTLAVRSDGPLNKEAESEGFKCFFINAGNLSFLNFLKVNKLAAYFQKDKIDTIIYSCSQDFKLGSLAAKKAGVKNIVYLRGLAVPVKNTPINKHILKNIVTHIIPNSEETNRMVLSNFDSAEIQKKSKVVYHGIDLQEYDSRSKEKLVTSKEILLGNAGRLTLQKGQKYLVEVAEELKKRGLKFKVLIAGEGELKEELIKTIEEKDLSGEIELLGFIKEMERFYHTIDVFLLSSEWEGFGYVIVEAMAAGKPVVAFNKSSNPEIISDGESGFLVDFPDVNQFADKIEKLIRERSLREKMGKDARRWIENNFQLDDKITEIIALLSD